VVQAEVVATAVDEATLAVDRSREGDRVDDETQSSVERLPHLAKHARHVMVRAAVAGGDERAVDLRRQVAHVRLDALSLEGERQPGAARRQASRDRPRDRALVGNAENQAGLSLETPEETL